MNYVWVDLGVDNTTVVYTDRSIKLKDYGKLISEHIDDVIKDGEAEANSTTEGSGAVSTDDLIAELPDVPEKESPKKEKSATEEILTELADELNRKTDKKQKKEKQSAHHPGKPEFDMSKTLPAGSGYKKEKNTRKRIQTIIVIILAVIVLALAAAYICMCGVRFGNDLMVQTEDKIAEILPWEYRSYGIFKKPVLRYPSDESLTEKEKMMALSWYEGEREERYKEYMKLAPDMDYSEAVWRVDMDIDRPAYIGSKLIHSADSDDPLLVVNKHFGFSSSYSKEDLTDISGGYQGTYETALAFKKMKEAADKEAIRLEICSGFRSIERQKSVYDEKKRSKGEDYAKKYVALPGHSEHHTGRAIDMDSEDGSSDYKDTSSYGWLQSNAYKYGFIFRYTDENSDVTGYDEESWHLTYVGETAANTMHALKIGSLEEYRVKYVDHRPCSIYNVVPWFWANSIEKYFSGE